MQGAEDVLDRVNFSVTNLNGRGAHQIGDLIDPGLKLRMAVEVHTLKHDAVINRGRFECHVHGVSSVQGIALDGDLAQK